MTNIQWSPSNLLKPQNRTLYQLRSLPHTVSYSLYGIVFKCSKPVQVFYPVQNLGLIFPKNNRRCLLNFGTNTLLFDFNLEKKHQATRKSVNQTLFSTKSITLNPMVQSDLVTYRGVTVRILFLKATNSL